MSLEMILLPISIAFAAIYYAYSKSKYHVKPRALFAQVALIGRTEDSETLQITVSLFQDETQAVWDDKLKKVFEMRESRLKFQNERMLEIAAEAKLKFKEIEETRLEAHAANNKTDNVVAMKKD